MVLAVAGLATQTRVLSELIAGLTLVRLGFQHLARGLVLELVVLAEKVIAKAALVHTAAVIPNTTFAFDTEGIHQRTGAGMRLKALPPVADPSFAMIANGSHHLQAGGVHSRMSDDTISGLEHALLLTALGTDWQALDALAKVAEGAGLLLSLSEGKQKDHFRRAIIRTNNPRCEHLPATFLAIHGQIARLLRQLGFAVANLLLAKLHLLSLFTLASLLLRHL